MLADDVFVAVALHRAGDDDHSWAYDGHRQKKWNSGCSNWGSKWHDGKIVGCAADVDRRMLSFSLNGSFFPPMGVAFQDINIGRSLVTDTLGYFFFNL